MGAHKRQILAACFETSQKTWNDGAKLLAWCRPEVLGLCGPSLALKSSVDLDLPFMAQAFFEKTAGKLTPVLGHFFQITSQKRPSALSSDFVPILGLLLDNFSQYGKV